MNELCMQNVMLYDGTGAPGYVADVSVQAGKIAAVTPAGAPLPPARCRFDAAGLVLTPGFIDAHSHGDLMLASPYAAYSKFCQGVTTQAAGQCGVSMWPAALGDLARHRRFVAGIMPYPDMPPAGALQSYAAYRAYADALPGAPKTALFTGHGSLRLAVMGYEASPPDARQLAAMCALLEEAMAGGSLGLSTGLVYAPGCYAKEAEIIALLRVARRYGGLYATHVRDEGDKLEAAEAEAIRCAQAADVPVFISHFKAAGRQNWGKPARLLQTFDAAIARGVRLTVDHYPYIAGQTALNVSIPPRFRKDGMEALTRYLNDPAALADMRAEIDTHGDYDNYIYNSGGFGGVMVAACPQFRDAEGMTVEAYAQRTGQTPFDAYADILRRNGGLGLGVYFHMSEDDLLSIARYPHTVIGTDGLLGRPGDKGHPRAFGSFPRAMCLYVKEKKILSLPEMVRRMTGLPAERLGLADRGRIAPGLAADMVLLDWAALKDRADYTHSDLPPAGIGAVLLDGKVVYGAL